MKYAELMELLMQIERSVGKTDPILIRESVLQAQEIALQMEQQLIATLRDNESLRARMEKCERATTFRLPLPAPAATDSSEGELGARGPEGVRVDAWPASMLA